MEEEKIKKIVDELLLMPRETEWFEFKSSYFEEKLLGEYISSLANSACLKCKPFGYLVFGIKDETNEIVGTNIKLKDEKIGGVPLENWLSIKFNPKIVVGINEYFVDDKKVVVIQVPAATDEPVKFDNSAYFRIGNSKKSLKDFSEIERQIWNNDKDKNFEKEVAKLDVPQDEVLSILDYSSYFKLTKQALPSNTEQFLEKMEQDRLVVKKLGGLYDVKNLGAILFAQNIKDFDRLTRKSVRVIVYDGISRNKIKKEQEGLKGYAVGFKGLIDYINDQLPSNEEISRALRMEKKMYPEVAIREFVANSLIHQDLSVKGAGPMIEIFDDRIEITNPGKPLISTDRFIDHPPCSRNEALAALMRRVGVCEEGGTGVDRAITSIEIYQLPAPKFEVYEGFTRVVLYGHRDFKKMSNEDRTRACYQHCVLKYLSNQRATNATLRERFGIPETNYPAISKVIKDTIGINLIKESEKRNEYVPWFV